MKFPGKSKDKTAIGLDIGSAAIKAVKIRSSNGNFELVDLITENSSPDPVAALRKIKDAKGIEGVNISLSGALTVIRYVVFPRMNPQELKQALKFEAQKHIPFAVSEANLDAFILKNDLADNKMLILLAAAKKEFVNQRLRLLTDSGLKANLIDLDSLALFNCFNFNYTKEDLKEHKTLALLNIGSEISSLNIADDGIPRLSRDIHFGIGNMAAKAEGLLNSLANEIRVSFDFFESQNASTVSRIFLSGGGTGFPGLKEGLASLLGIEVEIWDPFKKINIAGTLDANKIREASGSLAVALGLALR